MASENTIQNFIHNLEHGNMQNVIKGAMIAVLIIVLFLLYLFVHFRGFANEHAMDQAQIARALASGQGFSTKYIRPIAIWKLTDSGKGVPTDNFPDFFNAPLNPLVNSLALSIVKNKWTMTPKDIVYIGDRIIALFSIIFFLAAVGVGFFIARYLFDTGFALLACACVLVTDLLWMFSLSGLPQMMMLFLFMVACWFIICAQRAATEDRQSAILLFVGLAALFFGLLTLAHGLGFWFFLGFLVFVGINFRPLGIAATIAVIVYAITISPWLVYNYQTCGNLFGLGYYIGISGGGNDELIMRSLNPHIQGSLFGLRSKLREGIIGQVTELFSFLGLNLAAAAFFLSLLHPFKRAETAQFRWCVLLMWFFAVIGMSIFGVENVLGANQLHVLFLPIMVFYGLAFILVLWHRLEITTPLYRLIFLILIPFLCAVPMLLRIVSGPTAAVNWPPYIPPVIAVLGEWTAPSEIIASDVPWAVAWYAQRKSLLLPDTVRGFNEINDYRLLGQPIIGIYLTPVSGDRRFISGIMKGPYKEWGPFITRSLNFKGLPFRAVLPMPKDGETIFFADRERWNKNKKAEQPAEKAPE
ncbi:MAG: hypothetical protein ABIP97_01255 [Chthoniobacterales bacterium]